MKKLTELNHLLHVLRVSTHTCTGIGDSRMTLDPADDVYVDRQQITIEEGQGFSNDFVSETEPQPFMREQNIEFNVTTLKPDTNHFAYWSGTTI